MTAHDTAATALGPERDRSGAPGGASYRLGYPNGLSKADAFAQGGEDDGAGSRTRASENQQNARSQGAPAEGEMPEGAPAVLGASTAFPDRLPRRRAYQPGHREDVIATRLSLSEKAEIAAAAKRAGMYPSGYLAAAGLAAARGSAVIASNARLDAAIDELAALRAQLARVGNNINQIAHIYNAGGQPRPGELTYALTALTRVLARIDAAADALVKKRT